MNVRVALCQQEIKCFIFKKTFVINVMGFVLSYQPGFTKSIEFNVIHRARKKKKKNSCMLFTSLEIRNTF